MVYRTLSVIAVVLSFQGIAVGQTVDQTAGTDKCQCLCLTGQDEDGNGGRMAYLIHESADFSICPIFNDRSCEISDPDTGERRFGVSDLCEPLSDEQHEALKFPQNRQGQ